MESRLESTGLAGFVLTLGDSVLGPLVLTACPGPSAGRRGSREARPQLSPRDWPRARGPSDWLAQHPDQLVHFRPGVWADHLTLVLAVARAGLF